MISNTILSSTCIQIFILVLFIVLLVIHAKKTVYSFINVMLSGGIIFIIVNLTTHNFVCFSLLLFSIISIFLAASNIALIKHEGFRLRNLIATIIGAAMILASVILLLLSRYTTELNLIINYLYRLLSYIESIMLGLMIMGYISARQIPKYNKDYIIILGCSISKKGGLLPLLKGRTNRAIRYAWEQEISTGKPVKYVPSGGQGPNEIMSEGSAMSLYLEAHGAEPYEVLAEKESKNTWENFLFSRELILKENPDAKVAFATTNYHSFRSGLLARKAGFNDIEAISSTTKWYFWPNGFAREIIGILYLTWPVHLLAAVILAFI